MPDPGSTAEMKFCMVCHQRFGNNFFLCPEDGTHLIPQMPSRPAADRSELASWLADSLDFGSKKCAVCHSFFPRTYIPLVCRYDGTVLREYTKDKERPGPIMAERFQLISHLGSGTLTDVYAADDLETDVRVAIKILHNSLSEDAKTAKHFSDAALCSCHLNHPNIAATYSSGVLPNGSPFLVMEFLSGRSLSVTLSTSGSLEQDHLLKVFIQVCHGLEHAHKQDVFDKNLGATNIYLVRNNKAEELVKVVDFGTAERLFREIPWEQRATRTASLYGNPLFISPEYCRGEEARERSDLYSLGCTLYQAISGMLGAC